MKFGRWTYDENRMELVHTNGCQIDLCRYGDVVQIMELVLALENRENMTADDLGHLVRALTYIYPLREWLRYEHMKCYQDVDAVRRLTAGEGSRLH